MDSRAAIISALAYHCDIEMSKASEVLEAIERGLVPFESVETPLEVMAPCPFCGDVPDRDDPDFCYPVGRTSLYAAHCCRTGTGCGASILGDNAGDAIKAWNTRPSSKVAISREWLDKQLQKAEQDLESQEIVYKLGKEGHEPNEEFLKHYVDEWIPEAKAEIAYIKAVLEK
jgi:hypothetical protein